MSWGEGVNRIKNGTDEDCSKDNMLYFLDERVREMRKA